MQELQSLLQTPDPRPSPSHAVHFHWVAKMSVGDFLQDGMQIQQGQDEDATATNPLHVAPKP